VLVTWADEPPELIELAEAALGDDQAAPTGASVEIPVRYDGPDLDEVAASTGLSPEDVAARHLGVEYVVGFLGFAPGFAYLLGGDERLRVERRAEPRERVPAGSVALAGPYSGIYPRESPGGWQLIGSTATVLFDATRDPPALLSPGDRVRFVAA
jgi:KipI family sensor histidine kinase inhibitor